MNASSALKEQVLIEAPSDVSKESHFESDPENTSSAPVAEVDRSEPSNLDVSNPRVSLGRIDVSSPAVAQSGNNSGVGTPNKSSPRLSERRGVQALSLSTFAAEKPPEMTQDAEDFSRFRSELSSLTMNEFDSQSPSWSALDNASESQFWFAGGETASSDFSNHQLISPSSVSAEWTHWSSEEPPGSRSAQREIPGSGPGHSGLVSDLIASFGHGSHRGHAEIGASSDQPHLASNKDLTSIHSEYNQQSLQRHQYNHQSRSASRGPAMSEPSFGVLSAYNQQSLIDLESVTSQGSVGSTWSARYEGSVSSGSAATRDVRAHSETTLKYSFGLYGDLSPKSQLQKSSMDSFHESNVKRVQYYPHAPSPKGSSVPSPSTSTTLRITSAPYIPSSPVKPGMQTSPFFPGTASAPQHTAENTESSGAAGSFRGDTNAAKTKNHMSSYPNAESETDSDTTGSHNSRPLGEYSIHSGQYEPDIRNVFVGNIGRLSSDGVQQLIKYFANLGITVLKVDIKISFAFLEVRDTPDLQERIESIALGSGGHPPPFGRDGRLLRIEFVQQSSVGKQNIKMRRENMMQPTCSLFVVGFDHRRTSASTLASLFGKFGTVEHVEVKNNYAFVKFFNLNDSIAAQKAMHGFVWHDRTLSVEFSNRKSLGTLGIALLQHQQLHGLSGRPPIIPVHHMQERGGPAFASNPHHLSAPLHRSAPPHHSLQQQPSFVPSQHFSTSRPGLEHINSVGALGPVSSYDSSSMWSPAPQASTAASAARPRQEFSDSASALNYLYSTGHPPVDPRLRTMENAGSSMNKYHGNRNTITDQSFGSNSYGNANADDRASKLEVVLGGHGRVQRGYDSGGSVIQPLQYHQYNTPSYHQVRPSDHRPSPRPDNTSIPGSTYSVRVHTINASPEESLGSYTDHRYADQGLLPVTRGVTGLPKHHQSYQPMHREDQRSQPVFDVSGGASIASISSLGSSGSGGSRNHSSSQSGAEAFTPGIPAVLSMPRQSFMSHQIPTSSYEAEGESRRYSSLATAPLSFQEPFSGMVATSNHTSARPISSYSVDIPQYSRQNGGYSSSTSAGTGASASTPSGSSPFIFSAQSFPISPILSGGNAEQKSFFSDDASAAP